MDLHGGNIYKLMREKNIDEILDYSSNVNPFGLSSLFKNEMIKNMDLLEKYPDPDYIDLRTKIAEYNNCRIENVIVGNGATELIFLYMKNFKDKKVLIVSPSFSEYERALSFNMANIDYFELKEEENFILNLDKLKGQLKINYDLLVICNPNNPTGKLIKKDILNKILEELKIYKTKLFIDETFLEFTKYGLKSSIIDENRDNKEIFVLRAFTKFFAIPGLRLGYAISFDDKLLENLNKKKEPWTVNAFASLAGILFTDKDYIEKSKKWINEEKEYIINELKKIKNLKVYTTETNFILIKTSIKNAKLIRENLIKKSILIRDASNFKFLDKTYIRLAIKKRNENMILLKKLKKEIEGEI